MSAAVLGHVLIAMLPAGWLAITVITTHSHPCCSSSDPFVQAGSSPPQHERAGTGGVSCLVGEPVDGGMIAAFDYSHGMVLDPVQRASYGLYSRRKIGELFGLRTREVTQLVERGVLAKYFIRRQEGGKYHLRLLASDVGRVLGRSPLSPESAATDALDDGERDEDVNVGEEG